MAGDLNVGIRLTADGKGFVGEIRVAQRELDKLTGGTRKAGRANTQYAGTARRVETANRRVARRRATAPSSAPASAMNFPVVLGRWIRTPCRCP